MGKVKAAGKYVSSPGESITIELEGISEEELRTTVEWFKGHWFPRTAQEHVLCSKYIVCLFDFAKQFLPESKCGFCHTNHFVKVNDKVELPEPIDIKQYNDTESNQKINEIIKYLKEKNL